MRVTCPHCGSRLRVPAHAMGTRGRCPNPECRQVIDLPSQDNTGSAPQIVTGVNSPSPRQTPGKNPPVVPRPQDSAVGIPTVLLIAGSALLIAVASSILMTRPSQPVPAIMTAGLALGAPAEPKPPEPDYQRDFQPFINRYCGDCHAGGAEEAGISFDQYTQLSQLKDHRSHWVKVLKLIKVGAMPPPESEQPGQEELQKAIAWLDHQLFFVDCNAPQDPGHVTVRRLNRTEYNNTVNALLGITFHPADDFPSDDVGHGFDNIGDVLSVPPLLMEKYLAAAEAISEAVVPIGHPMKKVTRFGKDGLQTEGAASPTDQGFALVSAGRVFRSVTLPRPGKYTLHISARQDRAGKEDARMEIKAAGQSVTKLNVKQNRRFERFSVDLDLTETDTELSAAFLNDFYDENAKNEKDRNLHIEWLELEGPLDNQPGDRDSLVFNRTIPEEGRTPAQAATENLAPFLPRAFRRAVTSDEIQRFVRFTEQSLQNGATFDEAMRLTLQAILISPQFLFRIEGGRRLEGNMEMLDDDALASRLSYFLWSSMPDEELFRLAQEKRLHEPAILRQQTERMLKDPRAQALIANFAGQWLGLRKLTTNDVSPDNQLFPEFTDELRNDFWKETELFFGSVVQNDASIYNLLDGKYTFVNERLAAHYGLTGVTGPEFRRVELDGQPRGGVLTQGSVLTLTSFPNRTSPVKRGEWVLANLFNDPPPEAPPQVPPLDKTSTENPNLTFRQQLELHRADPGCASCHKEMDAIGFGLQNFDAIGRFRSEEGAQPIDASGVLPNGENFNGPVELIELLRKQKSRFGRCLTEKMMTYALGRGVQWYDRCAVDQVMADLETDDRFSTLIMGIVNSAPFQRRSVRPALTGDDSARVMVSLNSISRNE